jgi:hypothetical protein
VMFTAIKTDHGVDRFFLASYSRTINHFQFSKSSEKKE